MGRAKNPEKRMSLAGHLRELRRRIIIATLSILLAAVAGWFLADLFLVFLRQPIAAIAEERNATLNYTSITAAFDVKLQISLTIGVLISSPIWLYQIWGFIVPGLTKRERRYTYGFLGAAIPLFLGGGFVGWLIFPNIVRLLTSFAGEEDASFFEARAFLDFALKLMFAIGIAFVLPVLLVLLNFLGIISGKAMVKGWRWAVLVIVLFAGMATPAADIISMLLLAGVMTILFGVALLISVLHDRSKRKKQEKFLVDSLEESADEA